MSSANIVFIHIGPNIPAYLGEAILQVRRFNTCPLYLVAEQASLVAFQAPEGCNVTGVACEDLGFSPVHEQFRSICPFDKSFRDGFWTHTTERFFYLASLAEKFQLTNVVHMENDVMLYGNLEFLVPQLATLYPGGAAPYDHERRCVPSFVYAAQPQALTSLCQFIVEFLRVNPIAQANDMLLLALARAHLAPQWDFLPILPPFYPGSVVNLLGQGAASPESFAKNSAALGRVFDAAAIGQYLGGTDPRNPQAPGPGFINETSMLDPSRLTYMWGIDPEGRRIPYMVLGDQHLPITNLHIHCKDLKAFASL